MAKNKVTFGTMCNAKLSYAIVILYTDGSAKFVTDVQFVPCKECRWDAGKEAYIFDDRKYAEDICFGLNANGTGAFVITIPDYFSKEKFRNPQKVSKEEQNV